MSPQNGNTDEREMRRRRIARYGRYRCSSSNEFPFGRDRGWRSNLEKDEEEEDVGDEEDKEEEEEA